MNISIFIMLLVPVLISVAFITLVERKVLSIIGFRLGPTKVSFYGFLQPLGDAAKLMNKQVNLLSNFSNFFYYFSSFFMLFSALCLWYCSFYDPLAISMKFSLILFMIVLGFNSLNSIISGWSTFSKYSMLGSLRTVAQLISYESALYLCLFFFIYIFYNYSFFLQTDDCFNFFFILLPFCFYIWCPSFLAELNRTPYDFSEGESELVSGFNVEFGSKCFTLIFLAEYSNIIFFSLLSSYIFFNMFYFIFFFFILFYVIWIRSVLPRFRFDKLMMLAWKFFIPFLTFYLVLYFFVYY